MYEDNYTFVVASGIFIKYSINIYIVEQNNSMYVVN